MDSEIKNESISLDEVTCSAAKHISYDNSEINDLCNTSLQSEFISGLDQPKIINKLQSEFSVDPAFSSETILEPEYNNLINKNQYKKDLILRKLSFPLMIILSILLGFSAMCIYGKNY